MTPAIYDQYAKIVLDALSTAKLKLNKCRRNFMLEIFMLYLSIPTRINFLQLGRYSRFGEQRFRRQFEKGFDFFSFNKAMTEPYIGKRSAVAFDASFIHKSGKHTPCLGYFWSGCAGKTLKGLEVLSLSIVDADSRLSFHLQATQTPAPQCLSDNNLSLPDWYAAVIRKDLHQISSLTSYVVADAYFSKKGFVNQILDMDLHLVCKLRDDADLLYPASKASTGKRGRPSKYAGKVDPRAPDGAHFQEVENDQGIKAKAGIVYSKSLQRDILVIVEEFIIKGKTTYRLLFSTDTGQAPIDVIDIYHTRFQMEFGFRDAKQFAGLENSQARSTNKLDFHFNTALTTVNIAKVMQLKDKIKRELPFSMKDYKTLFHNALLLQLFFSKFGKPPNSPKNQAYFKELLFFGTLAA
jgi:Transposase DDE domain.